MTIEFKKDWKEKRGDRVGASVSRILTERFKHQLFEELPNKNSIHLRFTDMLNLVPKEARGKAMNTVVGNLKVFLKTINDEEGCYYIGFDEIDLGEENHPTYARTIKEEVIVVVQGNAKEDYLFRSKTNGDERMKLLSQYENFKKLENAPFSVEKITGKTGN